MKRLLLVFLVAALLALTLGGCRSEAPDAGVTSTTKAPAEPIEGCEIVLSDDGITVDGAAVATDPSQAVYVANDIIYYEAGHDFTYGEGTEEDAHSAEEAASHTVLHITQAGRYILSGKLSLGQIAVDLGEEAEDDPSAVVTLVLQGIDITCEVAPAIIFYNVYECGSTDTETATNTVDTSAAGANVVVADGTVNTVTGSYVARIYKPDSVVLNEEGTEVIDEKKLHKYDAAFYSKMSMNVDGGSVGDGILKIFAENEGLDSELHLTLNGGNVEIVSGNDGINTNEDYVSVTTVNGGSLNILVNGATGEGDGIDSNGWLVINGGTVIAQACAFSGDAGIDSDLGISINGGTVFATGNMLDRIADSQQNFAVFQFAGTQTSGQYSLKNTAGESIVEQQIENGFQYLIISSPDLVAGEYTLWCGETQLQGVRSGGASSGRPGDMGGNMTPPDGAEIPEGNEPPEMSEGMTLPEMPEGTGMPTWPEGSEPPQMPEDGEPPEGMTPPDGVQIPEGTGTPTWPEGSEPPQMPEDGEPPAMPEGMTPPDGNGGDFNGNGGEASDIFVITDGENYFVSVGIAASDGVA